MDQIEKRVEQLEQRTKQDIGPGTYVLPGLSLVALAVFCALWARSTGRDPWLWLAAGLVFNLFVLFAIWIKHDHDQKKKTHAEQVGSTPGNRERVTEAPISELAISRQRGATEQVHSSDQIRK